MSASSSWLGCSFFLRSMSGLLGEDHHTPEELVLEVEEVVLLEARDDERMPHLQGSDVEEGIELLALSDAMRGDLPLYDAGE